MKVPSLGPAEPNLSETRITTTSEPERATGYCTDCHAYVAGGEGQQLVQQEVNLHCLRYRHRVYVRYYRAKLFQGVPI